MVSQLERRDDPLVATIIVPVYNGARTLRGCLNSLIAQDYPANQYEIVVVDNDSHDNTADILESYAIPGRVRHLRETRILNAYGARNTGARAALGHILVFIDADCVARPNWLRNLLEPFHDPRVGVVIGDVLAYEPVTALERYYSSEKLSLRTKPNRFPGMRAGNCAIRRECFELLGGFDASISSGGDSDFLKRIVNDTPHEYRVNVEAVVYHRNYDNLKAIFRRGLRFGTRMDRLRGDPLLGRSYVPWTTNCARIGTGLLAAIARGVAYPFITHGYRYRGRQIEDPVLFVIEPRVAVAEMAGLLIGRLLRWRQFR